MPDPKYCCDNRGCVKHAYFWNQSPEFFWKCGGRYDPHLGRTIELTAYCRERFVENGKHWTRFESEAEVIHNVE